MYKVGQSIKADRDERKCRKAGQGEAYDKILDTLEEEPFRRTQHFERLIGNMKGCYSRQIDYHNRVVYSVEDNIDGELDDNGNLYEGIIYIHRAWGHIYTPPT